MKNEDDAGLATSFSFFSVDLEKGESSELINVFEPFELPVGAGNEIADDAADGEVCTGNAATVCGAFKAGRALTVCSDGGR